MSPDDRVSVREYVEALLRERDKAVELALASIKDSTLRAAQHTSTVIAIIALLVSIITAALLAVSRGG